ncbi:MAG: phosphoribosylamine--glycine ligase, partial [Akkermansiaceae bacterium]|nr:phosphoribosylamine--glycine ligase [Akkermansiaceae bacterium]
MRILVVGKGGREHALVKALAESPSRPELFCFPGSDAIFETAKSVEADGLESLVAWMVANSIDLCVAGEESYLVKGDGLANLCEKNN